LLLLTKAEPAEDDQRLKPVQAVWRQGVELLIELYGRCSGNVDISIAIYCNVESYWPHTQAFSPQRFTYSTNAG